MQLGNCRFDISSSELIDQESGNVWHLPRAELQVLLLLVNNQGKLVSKKRLKEGNGEHIPLSDSSVARAVFMLRSFLGPQHESLIQTVKGKGYQLQYVEQPTESDPSFNADLLVMPCVTGVPSDTQGKIEQNKVARNNPKLVIGSVIFIVIVASLLWFLSNERHIAHNTPPYQSDVIAIGNGNSVNIHLYAASNTNNRLLLQQVGEIKESFGLCPYSSWKHVYVSLSHDNQVLNMTLRGEHLGQSVVRNLKISDNRSPKLKNFVTSPWLQSVEICDY